MAAPLTLDVRTRTVVHVASSWPSDDGGWTKIDAWAQSCNFGMGNDMGSASLFTPSGLVMKPGLTLSALIKSQRIGGQYVRISRINAGGTVHDTDDATAYTPFWHGIITGRGIESNSDGTFINTYECAGLLSVLDSVTPKWHFHETPGLTVAADIGQAPVFNYLGAKKTGNRSSSKYDFNGVSAYVFSREPDAGFWTAADIVEYYLALYHYFGGGGPTFDVTGQTAALGWIEKWDLNGHNCGEALARVMSQKQGVSYRCMDVIGGRPQLEIKSMSQSSITVPATAFTPSFTLPANDEQVDIDLTSADHIQGFVLKEDVSQQADELTVEYAKTWYAATFSLFDHFQFDWTPADEANWDTYDKLATYGTLNTIFGVARVWRRFKLKADWGGVCVGGFQVPTSRTVTSDGLHGQAGVVGADGTTGEAVSGVMLELSNELPCLDGYDWATVDPATVDKTRRNAQAMAFMQNGDKWTTLGEQCNMKTIEIAVDSDLAAITFGEDAMEVIKAAYNEGLKVYVTLGLRGQLTEAVSWARDTTARARDQARCFTKARPSLIRKIIPANSVMGVDASGTLVTPAADIVLHDDRPLANSVLAISRPWYSESDWSASFTKTGEIDPSYAKPGSMITSLTHLEGDESTTDEDIVTVVTNVSYDFSEPGSTKVTTHRIAVDVEAVI